MRETIIKVTDPASGEEIAIRQIDYTDGRVKDEDLPLAAQHALEVGRLTRFGSHGPNVPCVLCGKAGYDQVASRSVCRVHWRAYEKEAGKNIPRAERVLYLEILTHRASY